MDTSNPQMVRKLSAVWFADIVGYTALSNVDEEAAIRLVGILQSVARRVVVQQFGGRIVKFIGDAVLAEFGSTDSSVRSAVALQETFQAETQMAGRLAKLRIGVHLGEVIATPDGDIYGDGVNTAARLQGQAAPGKVLISEDVWRQLRMRTEFAFHSLGEVELKGITARVAVFDVLFGAEAAHEMAQAQKAAAGPGAPASQGERKAAQPVAEPKAAAPSATPPAAPAAPPPPPPSAPVPVTAAAPPRRSLVPVLLVILFVSAGSAVTGYMMNAQNANANSGPEGPAPAEQGAASTGPTVTEPSSPTTSSPPVATAQEPAPPSPTRAQSSAPGSTPPSTAAGTSGAPRAGTAPSSTQTADAAGRRGGAAAGGAESATRNNPNPPASLPSQPQPQAPTQPAPTQPAPTQPAPTQPAPHVADPIAERELAITQATAALNELARAVQARDLGVLSGPLRMRSSEVGRIEQVYARVASDLRASMLNTRLRRMDQSGAEFDLTLVIQFTDAQGAQPSVPFPCRAFVAREASGWRITSVQILGG